MTPHQLPTLSDLSAARQKFSAKQQNEQPSLYKNECFAILGAAMEVQNVLGQGFAELVYHSALNVELGIREIPYETEKEIAILYKGQTLDKTYKADLICYGKIIVELKAVAELLPEHTAQLMNYLKATGLPMGILINFGTKPLRYKLVPNYMTK